MNFIIQTVLCTETVTFIHHKELPFM